MCLISKVLGLQWTVRPRGDRNFVDALGLSCPMKIPLLWEARVLGSLTNLNLLS